MAESPSTTLRNLWRPKLVKISALFVAGVAAYDSFSSQFALPKLGRIVGMSGQLLPWWGWLLTLQAIFVYALFEYVRRMAPALPSGGQPDLPVLDYQPRPIDYSKKQIAEQLEAIEQIRGEIEYLKEEREKAKTREGAQAESISGRVTKLDHKIDTMSKLALEASQLQGERNNLIQQQFDGVAADIKAAKDYAEGSRDALLHLLTELRGQLEKLRDHQDRMEGWVETIRDDIHGRFEFVDQGFAAILDRERLLQLAASIETVGEELSGPTRGEPMSDKDAWLTKFGEWHKDVEAWSRIGAVYRDGAIERIYDTPKSEYRGEWKATDDLFPDSLAVHDYKTFRIMLRNYYVERKPVDNCVRMAAFARPSTKGRSAVPRDKNQMPPPPKV
jgi:hypothetical protein